MNDESRPVPEAERVGPASEAPEDANPGANADAVTGAEADPSADFIRIDVPWRVYVKAVVTVLAAIAAVRFLEQITAVAVMLTLALFLTAVLSPLTAWLEGRGVGRGLASMLAVGAAVLFILGLLGLVIPPLVMQGIEFANDLPNRLARLEEALSRFPGVWEALERRAQVISRNPVEFFTGFLRFGANAVSAIFSAVLIATLALYFLIDHVRIRSAVLHHISPTYRDRVDRTITESARAIRAYVTGQAIVSVIFAVLTFVLLTILGVPYATILAAFAFVLDAIPNIGATVAIVLPALVAFSSEGLTDALIIVATFMVYQQIENNVISPKVLGGKLEIPPVLTLMAILVGGALLGVIGIIIAIPLAGTLPVIDRIWITGERVG